MALSVVVLAAGKGTRMRSALPKVLHPVAHKAMVQHVIDSARQLDTDAIHVIYGHGAETLLERLGGQQLNFVEQAEQLGTGHAVQQIVPHINDDEHVLILYGDVPLTRVETLQDLVRAGSGTDLALLTVTLPDPTGYGRIMRDTNGHVTGIVEQKDATPEQLAVTEANTGMMLVHGKALKRWLGQLSNDNAQGEYYLTDIVAMAAQEGVAIASTQPRDIHEVEGANNRVQLAALERAYQQRQAEQLMLDGATLLDPARVDVRGTVRIANDVVVDVNVIFEGQVELGEGVVIESNCILRNCSIAAGARIKSHSIVEDAQVGEDCEVGPYARLRPGSVLEQGAKVGNFVEMKKTRLGKGSKANHLTYLGDAVIGDGVNIGAGTITCNYDGVNKFTTEIDDGAFIGSNSSLVAPVRIGKQATVGAGSTVTKTIEDGELGIARGKQRNITGWQRPQKKG
ncbi:bifunctional UDP-N-acetylglucosamine diphosphorylase/glucosamine-1-phosphate N-acetyltransferase GlmU [Pseudidiomarina terrestris]|uniref:Bifunctional protein GlmU n=1 Tax=Pseudidiomarina terrestris TaxID=2820060 RepID=A0AAW7QYW4_9GAMM|nr:MULTISPECIES: bifunctional UDP-N-acetylglucosamine diphosphorylase/glucosamine-1-phosphate N-acetyltransferase GlmU [unclassified Pseudidiomarina]MDN7125347.1 bifunctional UDP-N-acetylglucosamine diphosphorylase/glucosamine-1-phosphate N-acetyltransferase GlmU [Pseudidiomarina sp. 1APP75-32.1]MDN7127951.1 bifunctional UDP-N-acetylglucosamine diphosphorylase/glucosamine-1-phosphate N-acetyltransferase GlmU [Pseudidiomarina sp. 1APR75-33.1]MDN7130105.1 bifunctional UDP-N-acetylglucosamine dipho